MLTCNVPDVVLVELTTTAVVSPIAPPPDRINVPLLTVAGPVKVFAPDSVSVPVPTFVSPFVPEITPLNAPLLTDKVPPLSVTEPAPPNTVSLDKVPIVSDCATFSVPVPPTNTVPVSDNAWPPVTVRTPPKFT